MRAYAGTGAQQVLRLLRCVVGVSRSRDMTRTGGKLCLDGTRPRLQRLSCLRSRSRESGGDNGTWLGLTSDHELVPEMVQQQQQA